MSGKHSKIRYAKGYRKTGLGRRKEVERNQRIFREITNKRRKK